MNFLTRAIGTTVSIDSNRLRVKTESELQLISTTFKSLRYQFSIFVVKK